MIAMSSRRAIRSASALFQLRSTAYTEQEVPPLAQVQIRSNSLFVSVSPLTAVFIGDPNFRH